MTVGGGSPLQPGQITIGTASDDGSVWWIDGQLALDSNFLQGRTERTATVDLGAGDHEIMIGWFERGGGANMEAAYAQGAGV
ncbi:MAG: hypothetical protein GTN78_04275, partial [Gemmatimonadales bacterium]|nr:hypothetical protein [Gemmatimonadales bacterium]